MPGLPFTRRDARALVHALVDSAGENRLMIYASAVAFRTRYTFSIIFLVGAQLDELLRRRA